MLISRRKEGESLLIGDDVEVRIVSVRGKKVILGVVAPKHVRIAAARLSEAELHNTEAAAETPALDRLLKGHLDSAKPVLIFGGPKTFPEPDDKKEG